MLEYKKEGSFYWILRARGCVLDKGTAIAIFVDDGEVNCVAGLEGGRATGNFNSCLGSVKELRTLLKICLKECQLCRVLIRDSGVVPCLAALRWGPSQQRDQ